MSSLSGSTLDSGNTAWHHIAELERRVDALADSLAKLARIVGELASDIKAAS